MPLARARRQFEVFDIAIVAVVTKALGAFLVLVIILLPYYRSDPANAPTVEVVRDHLQGARRAIEAAQIDLSKGVDAKELVARIEYARQSIEQAQGYVQGLRNKLDQASGQIKRLETDLADAKAKVEEVQREADQARQQIAALESTIQSLQRDNDSLRSDNTSLRAEAGKLKQDSQRLQDQVSDFQRRLQAEQRTSQEQRDRNSALERDRDRAQREMTAQREQNERFRQENERLQRERERLAHRASRNIDPSIVMRWFSVGLIMPECSDIQFALYVRWEGSLVNAGSGVEMPNREFEATDPTKRTTLLGHKYFDLGGKHEEGALGDKSLREAGFNALGKTQIKLFNAVSSQEGEYSLYVAPNDPRALTGRRCPVHPYYLSWAGATLGDRVVLTQDQPFAWLRRFRINKDGTNSLASLPAEDVKFQEDLRTFSSDQSRRLCSERSICGKEDAHRYALRTNRRNSRP